MVMLEANRQERGVRIHSLLFMLVLSSCARLDHASEREAPVTPRAPSPSQVLAPAPVEQSDPQDAQGGAIQEVVLSARAVCPGESVTVDIVPRGEGHVFAIDGMETESRTLQLTGAPSRRIIHVDAWPRDDRAAIESRQVVVDVRADCAQAALVPPTLTSRASWARPREVQLTVVNAEAVGAHEYVWDFGDGSDLQVTEHPAVDHTYAPDTLAWNKPSTVFDVRVTARTDAGDVAAVKSIAVHVPYARRKAQGVLQPPLVSAPQWQSTTRTASVSVFNPEPHPVTLERAEVSFQSCRVGGEPVRSTDLPLGQSIARASTAHVSVRVPEAPPDACGVALRMVGRASTKGGAQAYEVEVPVYVELARSPQRARPVEAETARVLSELSDRSMLPRGSLVSDDELRLLTRSRLLPALDMQAEVRDGRVPKAAVPGPSDECSPGSAEAPPQPGWVCRATDRWVRDQPYLPNAHVGDIVLSAACGDIGMMLRALDVPQTFSHAGIMTQHYDALRHSTALTKRFEDNRAGALGAQGVDTSVLRFALPGAIDATVDEAYHGMTWHDESGNKDYRVAGFNEDGTFCPGDDHMVYPLVVTGSAASAAKRKAIAQAALSLRAHYRFFSYTEGRVSLDRARDMPASLGGPSAATQCSSFIWTAARAAGVTLEGALEAGDVALGAKVEPGILDGLYFYSASERRAAASRLYSAIYSQVSGETGIQGSLVDAPDNWANQITNCFASDYCSVAAKDSTAWKSLTSSGRTVSPEDLLYWDDPYGRSEPLVYRVGTFRRIHEWQAPLGPGTLEVTVKDMGGAPVPGAQVRVDMLQASTSASGLAKLAPQAGLLTVSAQKRVAGVLHSGSVTVQLATGTTVPVALTIRPPAASMRSVRMSGILRVVDDEVFGKERASLTIREDVMMNPSQRTKTISWSKCAGGEARADARVTLVLASDNTIKSTATVKLYEGASCSTDDREDTKSSLLELGVGASATHVVRAKSTGVGGGDSGSLDLTVTNAQAP